MVTCPKAVLRGYDWLDTLAHEYTHLVVTQTSHNTVPIWLHEGLAKYLESRWRGPAGQALTPSSRSLLGERVKKNDAHSLREDAPLDGHAAHLRRTRPPPSPRCSSPPSTSTRSTG